MYTAADRLMRDATMKIVPGRAPGTVAGFSNDTGRIIVPGMADAVFNNKQRHRAQSTRYCDTRRPSLFVVYAIEGLGEYMLSFLGREEATRVGFVIDCLSGSTFIPLSICVITPEAHSFFVARPTYELLTFEACININTSEDPETGETYEEGSLELPSRPDIWARFRLPTAWMHTSTKKSTQKSVKKNKRKQLT